MLSLDSPRWATLQHAYGDASDTAWARYMKASLTRRSDVPRLSRTPALVGTTCRNRSRQGMGQFYATREPTAPRPRLPERFRIVIICR
jgi:hypothetical protein